MPVTSIIVSEAKRPKRHSKTLAKTTAQPSLTHLFGSRVRALRRARNLTLHDVVAYGGGGSAGRLSMLERGVVSPTLRSVHDIARALEVDPIDLLIDPEVTSRHRLVAASADATNSEAAIALLDAGHHHAPSARTVRQRAAALPGWAHAAVHQAVRALLGDTHVGFDAGLLELADDELLITALVVDALERVVRAAQHAEPVGAVRSRARAR